MRDLTALAPADVFGLPARGTVSVGNYADLVLVDPTTTQPIRGTELHTSCDWTPFEGQEVVVPELTLARGRVAYNRGEPFTSSPSSSSSFSSPSRFDAAEGQNVRNGR